MAPFKKRGTGKRSEKRPLREVALFLVDILYNAAIIIALVILIRSFLISPFRVIGSSMADTLKNGEFILIDKLSYHLSEPDRGDPIVFLPPVNDKYKFSYKFQEKVTTDSNGMGTLDISSLKTQKKVFYCQNELVQKLWFCQDKVKENDLVYFRVLKGENDELIDVGWEDAQNKRTTLEEVRNKQLVIEGNPDLNYLVRIYNSTGPEYFVKRVIGTPGDIIKIENGRVYIKPLEQDDFIGIDEIYLNKSNQYNTYFKNNPGNSEFKVPEGHYFVLGDNRSHSNDSRHWFSPIGDNYTPYVDAKDISGKVLIVLWPPDNLRLISAGVLEDL